MASKISLVQREQVAGALPTLVAYVQLERQVLREYGVEDNSIPVVDVSIAANGNRGD